MRKPAADRVYRVGRVYLKLKLLLFSRVIEDRAENGHKLESLGLRDSARKKGRASLPIKIFSRLGIKLEMSNQSMSDKVRSEISDSSK